MRRFIRYLYEYEEEKKMRNVGFVKVERDMEQCVIHVHGKGFRMEEHMQGLEVYLFWNQEGSCIGIHQGVTEPPAPGLNYQLCYTPEDMGKKENYDLVNGIILKDVNGHWYAAVWNDDVVNVCRMLTWDMEEEKTLQNMENVTAEDAMSNETAEDAMSNEAAGKKKEAEAAEVAVGERVEVEEEAKRRVEVPVREDAERSAEVPIREDAERSAEVPVREDAERSAEVLVREDAERSVEVPVREDEKCNMKTKDREEASGEQEEKYSNGSNCDINGHRHKENNSVKNRYKVRKIQRKDMVCLPRCEWKHANNSVLVHGYYNYHHLILTVCDGQLKLGVPGIYHPQEARAAQSFGFSEFLPASELELTLTEEEKNDRETFGYWCRNVRGSVSCAEV